MTCYKNILYPYQIEAVGKLRNGAILCGGVGSGKSLTAIAYYMFGKGCNIDQDIYIITTAKKRDSLEWEGECAKFGISTKAEFSVTETKVKVDSWNNIKKYAKVENTFFIFDEQRLIGSGVWVKTFLKIAKHNRWILLTATPGDTWTDYIPVFVANGFYKNRTEFLREHAVYNRFTKFPKVERFVGQKKLLAFREKILVTMDYTKRNVDHHETVLVGYDKSTYMKVMRDRWNIFKQQPIVNISELCYLLRKVVNSHSSRITTVKELLNQHDRVIIFYNFNYELEVLKKLGSDMNIETKEWNGHVHQELPVSDRWIYLVQYTAGAEGWNCITTNVIIFFSQNYSYKIMIQSAGRIDRLNSPYKDLYYYHLKSKAPIDLAIDRAIKAKRDFNVRKFVK